MGYVDLLGCLSQLSLKYLQVGLLHPNRRGVHNVFNLKYPPVPRFLGHSPGPLQVAWKFFLWIASEKECMV